MTPGIAYVLDAPTRAQGAKYALGPNRDIEFSGGTPPRHRKQFIVTNLATSNPIQIWDRNPGGVAVAAEQNAGQIVTVFPSSSITIFSSAKLWVRNPSDSLTISVQVGETFYD